MRLLDGFAQRAVASFWSLAGEVEPFPRTLERPVLLGLPVAIVKLPRLRVTDVNQWLTSRGLPHHLTAGDRRVRGCLVAASGSGIIFLDGTDPDDEKRYTLAHEVAHFLVDYWLPRTEAVKRLGASIIDVLDGRRSPTTAESVHSALGGLKLGVHVDLLEREDEERTGGSLRVVWDAEQRADRVALALLAPAEAVLGGAQITAATFPARVMALAQLLTESFGLPIRVARDYAGDLLASVGRGASWVEGILGTT